MSNLDYLTGCKCGFNRADLINLNPFDRPEWRGIAFILADDTRNTLDYVEISMTGSDLISIASRPGGLVASSFSTLSFTYSSIMDCDGEGLFVDENVVLTTFQNTRFENNTRHPVVIPADQIGALVAQSQYSLSNGENSVEVFESTVALAQETTWNTFNDGTPYHISGDIDISSGVSIAPSARFHFDADLSLLVTGDGYLTAIATSAAEQIVFTARDEDLPWRGIAFNTDDFRNELQFVEVSYAGSDVISIAEQPANVVVNPFDGLTIINCRLSNSDGNGFYADGTANVNNNTPSPAVLNTNTFENNALGNVFVSDD